MVPSYFTWIRFYIAKLTYSWRSSDALYFSESSKVLMEMSACRILQRQYFGRVRSTYLMCCLSIHKIESETEECSTDSREKRGVQKGWIESYAMWEMLCVSLEFSEDRPILWNFYVDKVYLVKETLIYAYCNFVVAPTMK